MRVAITDGPVVVNLGDGQTRVFGVHVRLDSVTIKADYWPGDDSALAPYITTTIRTNPESAEYQVDADTYLSIEQAEAMRDALTAALDEAGKDSSELPATTHN